MEPNRCNDACARSRFSGRRFPWCSHRKPVPTGTPRLSSKSWPRVRPPVAARPMRSPPRARSWRSSSAGPGRVTPRTTRALPGREGARPRRRDGRSASRRPGGPAADAAATPTTPPPVTTQTHAKSMASTGGDCWSAGEHPVTGRMDARPSGTGRNSLTAPAAGAEVSGGIEGGRQHPSPARGYTVGTLACHSKVASSQLGGAAENTSQGTARNSAYRAVARKLHDLLVASLRDDEAGGDHVTVWRTRRPLSRRGVSPTLTPRGPEVVDPG